jgi:hypothetical protein
MPDDEEPPSGDAAQAFDDLRAEVSVLRLAVEALPEQWAQNQPPDYTESLGEITQGLAEVADRLDAIEEHPALRMTPEQHQAAIAQASNGLMRETVASFYQATKVAERERDQLAAMIGSARAQDKQLKWLLWTAGIALLFGLLVSPVFARLLPFGLDGQVAAFIMRGDRLEAGAALMQAGNPEGWRRMAGDLKLLKTNQETLVACRDAAAKTKKEQRCTIVVPGE